MSESIFESVFSHSTLDNNYNYVIGSVYFDSNLAIDVDIFKHDDNYTLTNKGNVLISLWMNMCH